MDLPIRFEISRRIYNQDAFDKEYKHTPLSKNKKSSFFENFPRCSKDELKSTLFTWIPLFDWVPKYKLNNLLPDLMAGFTVAILSIPQEHAVKAKNAPFFMILTSVRLLLLLTSIILAMAYASLANVPEVIGLYTSFFPCILYAIFGTSQHVSLGMFAVIALLVNSAQQRLLPNSNFTEFSSDMRLEDLPSVQFMVTLTFTVGLVMLVMAVLQLHILASYLCDPLINGFTTASAIHIIVLQIPPMLQIEIGQHSGFFKLIYITIDIISNILHTNIPVFILSLICVVVLYLGKTFLNPQVSKLCPLPLPLESFIVIITTLISYLYHFNTKYEMKIVDHIPKGLPAPIVPNFSQIPELLPDAIVIAIVTYAVTFSIGKLFGRKNKYRVDPRQELRSLAICQILPCFFLCHPSSVNLSRATIVEQAGAKTQITNLVSAAFMLIVMLWAGPILEPLPMCVLSAIIFVVLLNVLKQFGELKSLWKASKYDFTIWVFAFFVTILWDVSQGLVASIVFSLFTIIVRIQWADTKQIAKIGDTELYKDIESHPVYHYRPDVSIFHFNAPLLYVNSERFKEHALNIISDAQTSYFKPQFLILDASGITSCDKIGALTISELAEELSQIHVTLLIACPSDQLREICESCHVYKTVPSCLFFPTVHDATLFVTEKQVQNILEVKHI